MSEPKNVFVTGATGFLGSHLAYRLLEQGHHVTALVRGSKSASARERAIDVLEKVAGDNGLNARLDHLTVLEGDISQPDLGLGDKGLRQEASRIDEVWHCAASLSFTHENRDEIFLMNVGGMENILQFVGRTSTKRLQHVSTAYVAGNREVAYESEVNVGQTFRNAYEESKCRAEVLIEEAGKKKGDVAASVYRPSIVIGDSTSGRVTHFHGVYAFIRGLFSAVERLRRKLPEPGLIHLPFRVPGGERTTLNFVPIDYVVNGMVEIGAHASSIGGTYHLTNPHATENNVWLPNICRLIGVDGIHLVSESSFLKQPMNRLEALFQKQMAFYYMYLKGEPAFDCRNTLDALKGTGVECPRVTVEFIQRMVGWYLDFLRRGGGKG